MKHHAEQADELYVLGDLFEAWIGDDAMDAMALRVIDAFYLYSSQGGKLYFLHGNRDFLLGAEFIKATSGELLTDPHHLTLAGQSALLMHGDSLCTQDEEYMAFRALVRDETWQKQFLSLTLDERKHIAQDMRDKSSEHGKSLSEEISDVTPSEVIKIMEKEKVSLLIHGHTHRQARHDLGKAERIVLGDWGDEGSVLVIEDNRISLNNFSFTTFHF